MMVIQVNDFIRVTHQDYEWRANLSEEQKKDANVAAQTKKVLKENSILVNPGTYIY